VSVSVSGTCAYAYAKRENALVYTRSKWAAVDTDLGVRVAVMVWEHDSLMDWNCGYGRSSGSDLCETRMDRCMEGGAS